MLNLDTFSKGELIAKLQKLQEENISLAELCEKERTIRRGVENELNKSEDKYKTLFENSGTSIMIIEEDATICEVNNEFESRSGYDRIEIEGIKKWTELVVKDDLVRMLAQHKLRRENQDEAISSYDFRYVTKTGEIRNALINIQLIPGSKKSIASIIDLTKRIKAENELKHEQYLLNTLMNNIPAHIYFKDRESRFSRINNSHAQSFGLSDPGEAIGKTDFDFFTREHAQKAFDNEQQIIRTGLPISVEEKLTRVDHPETWVAAYKFPLRDQDGIIIGTFGISWDINERKRAEETLLNKHLMLRTVIDNIPDSIYAKDMACRKILVNLAEMKFAGVKSDTEILGKNDFELYPKRLADEFFSDDQKVLQTGIPVLNREEYIIDENKKKRWLLSSKLPLRDKDGEIIGLVGIGRDITDRKQAEELQQQSEEKYSILFENMAEGVGYLDNAETFIFANPAAEKIFGVAKDELKGLCINDFLTVENIEKIKNQTQDRILGKSSVYELEIVLKNGNKKDIHVSATPYVEDGKFIGAFGIFHDITESKQVQLALKESEELYRNLVEAIPDGVYKSTEDGKFVDVNPAMVEMLGYSSKEELMAIDIKTQLYFNSSDRENAELQEKLKKIGVYRMKKKDGSEIWVEDHGWLNYDEKVKILFHEGIMRDVTERKKAETALIESENLYRNLVERMPDGVYKSTHEGRFVDVNPAMVQMLGYNSKEELLAIDIKTELYFEPTDRESLILLEKLEEMGVYSLKKKDGSAIWVEDHGWYNLDEEGHIVFHEGIMRDITERKWAEEEIKQKNEELVKILAEKDKFFSIIAHDLRSPFNGFLGLTQVMAEKLPTLTMDEIQKIAVRMRGSATNLFSLLENLLQWAQIQQGLFVFNPVSIQLLPLIEESLRMSIEPAKSKEIEIISTIPGEIVVLAESNLLQTVIRNLVSNAIKFTPKGGKIYLSAEVTKDNSIKICIKDTGIGMSQSMVDNLFRLDVQTGRKGTAGEPSTGLGLILCKDFVDKHGGKISVESEEGKGSMFCLTLPSGVA